MLTPLLVGLVKLLVGAYPRWIGCQPREVQRIYFANHASHIDTVALWSALPPALRAATRPVAARDYWSSGIRALIAGQVLDAVLIERDRSKAGGDPLAPLHQALDEGASLIIFPEGTRNHEVLPGAFKAGLYHLARRHPDVELVPVYLDNARRALPKGSLVPVPLVCSVRFGAPLTPVAGEDKDAFLARARAAVVELA